MTDANEIRAGLFLVGALVILIVGSLWIAGIETWGRSESTYQVLMKGAAGVRPGDRVRVSGVEAGRIQEVILRPGEEWPVLFRVTLDPEIPVSEEASAHFAADGLLGAPYLEIDTGSADSPSLPPGTPIVGTAAVSTSEALGDLGELSDRAKVLVEESTEVMGRLSERIGPLLERFETLLSDENQASLSASLAALRDTLETAGPQLSDLLGHLDELTTELDVAVEGVPELITELQGLGGDLRSALGADGQRLAGVLEAAEATLGSAGSGLNALELNRAELEAMLRDLREATANLKAFSQAVTERPSLLIRKSRAPDRKPGEGAQP